MYWLSDVLKGDERYSIQDTGLARVRTVKNDLGRTYRLLAIAICVLLIVGVSTYLLVESTPRPKIVVDWRVKITFHDVRTGYNSTPPALIGTASSLWLNHTLDVFGPPGQAPLTTRDDSGTVYIQSTVYRLFSFGDFFNIWGQPFDSTCVPDWCVGTDQPPPLMSDGRDPFCINRNLSLQNGKDWIIFIGPHSYAPPGSC